MNTLTLLVKKIQSLCKTFFRQYTYGVMGDSNNSVGIIATEFNYL